MSFDKTRIAMTDKKYFYKILDSAPPSPLPETLPATELDTKDNFIHLSTAKQIPVTADLFFADHKQLWLLKLRVADLDGEIKYDPRLPNCPHVHDSKRGLGKGNVEEVIVVEKPAESIWAKVPELDALED